jgi:hypothetical protein
MNSLKSNSTDLPWLSKRPELVRQTYLHLIILNSEYLLK